MTAENGSETRLIRPLGRVAWRAHPPGSPADPIRDARVTRRLCGVVLPCCDDRPVGGGGGCRACARGPAVGVIAAGFAGAGVAGCLLVRVPALLAAVPGGSGTGRDRLVTG